MVSVVRRKILKEGGSRTVALPPHWLDALGLDRGDVVEVVYNDLVLVMPIDFSVEPDSLRRELERIARIRKTKLESVQVVASRNKERDELSTVLPPQQQEVRTA